MNLRRIFTEQERAFIAANYGSLSAPQLDKALGRCAGSVKNYVIRAGLKKGVPSASLFQPGNTPWNVGIPFRPARKLPLPTPPHNAYPDGTVTVRQRPNGKPYKFRRLAPGKWVLSHRWNWEQVNGPVPPGCLLRCQDGDSLNDSAVNWQPVSRCQNAELSGLWAENRASDLLTPCFLAASLTKGRPELRPAVLANPDLLEVQRLKITLNRVLKR